MKNSFLKKVTTTFAVSLLCATSVMADYPDQQINIVVPFSAGGGSDRVARILDKGWTKLTGTGWKFQYKPGAGGAVGTDAIARAKNDGYTIGMVNLPSLVIQPNSGAASFTVNDFSYLGRVNSDPIALVVASDSPYKSLADFVAAAKESPKVLTLAITGTLSTAHIGALEIMRGAGIEVTLVPTQGGSNTVARTAGGHVSAGIIGAGLASTQETLRTLAISGSERIETQPDVPVFSESGFDVSAITSRILIGPKDISADELTYLRTNLAEVAQSTEIKADFLANRQIPVWQSGEELGAEVASMEEEIRMILKEFKIIE